MTSGLRSFNHKKIGCTLITMRPHFQNQLRSSFGRNNWCNFCYAASDQFWQIHRKSGSADDYVCTSLHRFLHMLFVMFQCHHDIDANQTSAAGDLFCPADVFTYGKAVTSCLIPFKTFLVISNLCRRNNPDASLCRHCTGKRASADTNSHTALDDWFLCCQFSYLEWL